MAREACLRAEDARVIALRAERAEALEAERQAGIARENAEKQKAEEARMRAEDEARARRQAELDRLAAEQAKSEALTMAQNAQHDAEVARQEKAAAEQAKAEALQAKADADAARAAAEQARAAAVAQQQQLAAEADRAKMAAADSDRLRQKAEQDQAALRQQLLDQFNAILQTRDTARGLIVNMSDVLFDTGKYTLKPGAREKLAKVSGIILGHPGLKIAVEGHTDSIGGDEYNMRLSENRAFTVRDFLVNQGVPAANVSGQGFGKTMPVADNSTAAGRQQNRRVELVVSGEILGTTLTTTRTTGTTPNQ